MFEDRCSDPVKYQVCLIKDQYSEVLDPRSRDRYVLHQHLMDFFYAGGNGIGMRRMMEIDEFRMLNAELKLRSVKTVELIRLFYHRVSALLGMAHDPKTRVLCLEP